MDNYRINTDLEYWLNKELNRVKKNRDQAEKRCAALEQYQEFAGADQALKSMVLQMAALGYWDELKRFYMEPVWKYLGTTFEDFKKEYQDVETRVDLEKCQRVPVSLKIKRG